MNTIDIHCHPSLKVYLLGHHIYHKHLPLHDVLPTGMNVDLNFMKRAGVNAITAVHYLPEKELKSALPNLGKLLKLPLKECRKLSEKFEDVSSPDAPFHQLLNIIDVFENDLDEAKAKGHNVAIARNYSEFEKLINEGNTVFIHSIEGANSLGSGLSETVVAEELDTLIQRGICQFTIAHFFENILVTSQGGIPPMVKKHMGMPENENPNPSGRGLSEIGKKMIAKMLDTGIIVDLVHCPPQAVKEIHQINSARGANMRPLVYSHTGIRELAKFITNPYDLNYMPSKDDVLAIKNCGGTLGVIFMNYWLNGKEEDSFLQYSPGIPLVMETIQTIAEWCGSNGKPDYSYVSIGTDLDGFTETPDDLSSTSHIKNLIDELRKSGISESDLNKICFENYRRVLKNGWH